jgi:hypothetical protein
MGQRDQIIVNATRGGPDDDVLIGGPGIDVLDGAPGNDIVIQD